MVISLIFTHLVIGPSVRLNEARSRLFNSLLCLDGGSLRPAVHRVVEICASFAHLNAPSSLLDRWEHTRVMQIFLSVILLNRRHAGALVEQSVLLI